MIIQPSNQNQIRQINQLNQNPIVSLRKIRGYFDEHFSDVHNYLNDLKKKGETQSGDDVGNYISKLKNKVKMNKNFQLYKSKLAIR